MCIAILNTKGVTLKKKLLNNCWENNGDGAGMLYSLDGEMQVFKEMKSFDKFYNEYTRVRQLVSSNNIVLHFRISTHGKVNETNCHPFLVHNELGFVHNGMIYNAPTHTDYSDTYMFNECILKAMQLGFEYNEHVLDMLQSYIGMGSKLIFLNSDDDYAIVNEKSGHWNMNCWFSNDSYKRVNNYVDYGGTKRYKSGYKSNFDKGLSGNSWGSHGWRDYDDWYDQSDFYAKTATPDVKAVKDRNEFHYCQGCDMTLYGINEINRGMCEWCHEEQIGLADAKEEDICEMCENDFGPYNKTYGAHLCSVCYNDIEGQDGDNLEKIDPIQATDSPVLEACGYRPMYNLALQDIINAERRAYVYNADLSILECETEDGLYVYDKQKKLWFKKDNLFRGKELGA